jgi:phasin
MTTATRSKPSKTAAAEAFDIDVSTVEVPAVFRDFAEKGIAQARDAYARMKSAAEEATDVVENTYETARENAYSLGVKALELARSNTDASFALARDLFGAKTFAEVIELQTAFARKQFDSVSAQVKELQDLTAKFVTESAKPVAAQVEKTFKDIKAA